MTQASFAREPARDSAATPAPASHRALRIWLWTAAALVFCMVVLGGTTRLTESGLSITEWKPITGVLPPLSQADWLAEFARYKEIPQYQAMFSTMTLDGFKFIFMWEWSHRLLGRLIGLVFAVPLVIFWLRGMIPRGLTPKLVGILALGGLQGFVGWWMVSSGLVHRVEVAQERLALHLILASITFALIVYIAASLTPRKTVATPSVVQSIGGLRRFASAAVLLILVQIFLGGLVAGLRAGRAYNTWPLMDGHFIPPSGLLLSLEPYWRNFTDNLATVQFQHRMVAYLVLALVIAQAFCAKMWAPGTKPMKRAFHLMGVVLVQVALGIVTLMLVVPLWAGLVHQAFAMFVLATAVINREMLSKKRITSIQPVASA